MPFDPRQLGAISLRIVQRRDVDRLGPVEQGVDRHMVVGAALDRHHPPRRPRLEQLHGQRAERETDHAVERIGLAGAHQIAKLLQHRA